MSNEEYKYTLIYYKMLSILGKSVSKITKFGAKFGTNTLGSKARFTINGNINMTSTIKNIPVEKLRLMINDGNYIRIWDPINNVLGEQLKWSCNLCVCHTDAKSVAISSDGNTAITGTSEGYIEIWDLRKGKCVSWWHAVSNSINHIIILHNNKVAIVSRYSSIIHIINIDTKSCEYKLNHHDGITISDTTYNNAKNHVNYLGLTYDGYLISISKYNTIKIWDTITGKLRGSWFNCQSNGEIDRNVNILTMTNESIYKLNIKLSTESNMALLKDTPINAMTVLSNGLLARGSADGYIIIWDMKRGELIHAFKAHKSPITIMIALPNNGFISGTGNELSVWE